MQIPYINLVNQHSLIKNELLAEIEKVLISGNFILGDYVKQFEEQFAELCGTKYSLGVASGTDALILAMKVLNIGEGDEVITAPNSFLASASAIVLAGAKPVFADVKDDFNIDPKEIKNVVSSKTKAIIPVHLTGKPADMNAILKIANEHNLHVIEDCAQAVRAEYYGKRVGSFGIIGAFSLHPLKNLNSCGDGGMITTDDKTIYEELLKLRNHGLKNRDECETWSINSRLDTIQAAILKVKLKYLEKAESRRREIASIYQKELMNFVKTPLDYENEKSVYHTFIIQTDKRDELMLYLKDKGVETKIHYPIPIHLQEAAKSLGYAKGHFPIAEKQAETIISLPVYPELTNEQVIFICEMIVKFFTY